MARSSSRLYRKVEISTWTDKKVREFSRDAKLLWLYLMTGTETIIIPGVMVARQSALAEVLGMTASQFRKAWGEIEGAEMADADWSAGLIVLRRALLTADGKPRETAKPEGPNVIITWARAWERLPECDMRRSLLDSLRLFADGLSDAMRDVFLQAFDHALRDAGYERMEEPSADPRYMASTNPCTNPSDMGTAEGCAMGSVIQETGNRKQETGRESALARDPRTPEPGGTPRDVGLAARATVLWTEHVRQYDELRAAISPDLPSLASGAMPIGWRDLRERLRGYTDLDAGEKACRHVLAVRREEAESKRTMRWFGHTVWREDQFTHALSTQVASRAPPSTARPEFVPHYAFTLPEDA